MGSATVRAVGVTGPHGPHGPTRKRKPTLRRTGRRGRETPGSPQAEPSARGPATGSDCRLGAGCDCSASRRAGGARPHSGPERGRLGEQGGSDARAHARMQAAAAARRAASSLPGRERPDGGLASLSIYPSICLSIYPSIPLPFSLHSSNLSLSLSESLSLCLSASLFPHPLGR